jgi:hypothetical protein
MNSYRIRLSADLVAGVALSLVGLAAIWGATRYNIGSAARMGPGFMPLMIGIALTLFGTILVGTASFQKTEAIGEVTLRPVLLVLCGVVAFGLLIYDVGFLAAVVVLVVFARLAGRGQRLAETAILAVGLALLGAGIFVWGLGLPLPLLPR